jgi:hypothetical protein
MTDHQQTLRGLAPCDDSLVASLLAQSDRDRGGGDRDAQVRALFGSPRRADARRPAPRRGGSLVR